MTRTHPSKPSPFQRLARAGFHRALARIREGELIVEEAGAEARYGRPSERVPWSGRVIVNRPSFFARAALGGTIGMCESYMDGDWDADDLATVGRVLLGNQDVFHGFDRGSDWLKRPLHLIGHRLRRNSRGKARRNIADHYDLGNDFFERFLDPTLTYSAGIFERPEGTMEEASTAKYERICRKLGLRPEHHVLEIGTGWGGGAASPCTRPAASAAASPPPPSRRSSTRARPSASGLPASQTVSRSCSRTTATCGGPSTAACPSR
jgi:cyclopropane-fatty-acyl-phospholipid synthase